MKLIGGGHIKDYPKARRMFPGRKKRLVKITAKVYYGLGHHYWITMHEEDNPIWDAKERAWRTCWDDTDGRGAIESKSFLSMVSAQQWIRATQKKMFPTRTHKLGEIDFGGLTEEDEKLWFGIYKEGD